MSAATEADFALHPRLAADTLPLGDFPLCRLLLMDDRRFPWCLLVPRRAGVRGIHQLPAPDRRRLWQESHRLTLAMLSAFGGDQFNLAALGNQVPQLHLHHVVRRIGDAAWPRPVWGCGPTQRYAPDAIAELRHRLSARLGRALRSPPGGESP